MNNKMCKKDKNQPLIPCEYCLRIIKLSIHAANDNFYNLQPDKQQLSKMQVINTELKNIINHKNL